ncbi:MAG TPA: DEAD/DEAH box helicase [Candidatus Saccharimonadales bacterium]|nr:DEAD/DEAH box helicase [Candidatus Saccharimonadales bacterium]
MSYNTRNSIKGRQIKRRTYGAGARPSRRVPKKDYINPQRFIKVAQPIAKEEYAPRHEFSDFSVNPLMKANLAAKGYHTPTPIQDQTIPPALEGKDIIGIADTGTGKTAAFSIPVLQGVMMTNARALIIAPTRELAQQIDVELSVIAAGSNLRSAVLIGGSNMAPQLRDLRTGARIVVGTPGRIKDHLERGSLKLKDFKYVVLDEVDRMLDMGFVRDIRFILERMQSERQSFFFSATFSDKVATLITEFSRDPVTVSVKSGDTSSNVHQDIVRVTHDKQKTDKLHDLLLDGQVRKAIIFDDTQRGVERLSEELTTRGFNVDSIHGGKTQSQRQRSLRKFKQNEVDILVATDVAARGLDVQDVTHVINYTVPASYDDYIHRIGRVGRAGNVGHAFTFVTDQGGYHTQR